MTSKGIPLTKKHKKILSERMKKNNPMFNPKIVEKNVRIKKKHFKECKIKAWNKGLKGREYLKHYKNGHPMYKKHHSDESKKKMSKTRKGRTSWNKGKKDYLSEESKRKIGNAHKGLPSPFKGRYHTKEANKKNRLAHLGRKPSEETKKKLRKLWQNPEYVKKMIRSFQIKPNKSELILDSIIKQITNDFKYNGDFSQGITIGGKIPDFVNCNGKKQIIELFGKYWHSPLLNTKITWNKTYQGTIKHYKKYGFKCLIIWDNEMRNKDMVKNKIELWMQS